MKSPAALFLTFALAGCVAANPDYTGPADGPAVPDLGARDFTGCVPLTCLEQRRTCGSTDNGCGVPLDCGQCEAPLSCGGGGIGGQCGVAGEKPPSCQLGVTPASGGADTTYTLVMTSTNAEVCLVSIDGGPTRPFGCNTSFSGGAAAFGGPGEHKVAGEAHGPGGSTVCGAAWTIQP